MIWDALYIYLFVGLIWFNKRKIAESHGDQIFSVIFIEDFQVLSELYLDYFWEKNWSLLKKPRIKIRRDSDKKLGVSNENFGGRLWKPNLHTFELFSGSFELFICLFEIVLYLNYFKFFFGLFQLFLRSFEPYHLKYFLLFIF